MTNPIGRFHNVETGEVIDRELTNEELDDLLNPKPVELPWKQTTSNE
jgi:uridine kinase